RSPEEMDRAALADESRAELVQHAVRRERRAPEALGGIGIVRAMRLVAIEWDAVLDLCGRRADRRGELELIERGAHGAVEICDRARAQIDRAAISTARREDEAVVDEVHLEIERARSGRNRAGGPSARRGG